MGLAGRKVKQRIATDPRNLTWADDAAKFGQQYLAKLGWDPSRGLGASEDGRTSHIKVAQKLNLLGIGVGNAKMGDNTVAWKQNRDYEMLLKRLNESVDIEEGKQEGSEGTDEKERKRKRKRKGDATVDADYDKDRKKRKEENKDKREKGEKKRKAKTEGKGKEAEKSEEERNNEDAKPTSDPVATEPTSSVVRAPTPRLMAHRARFLRSKQLASRSSTAVAEILGISSSSNSPGPSSLSGTSSPFSVISKGTETGTFTPVHETNHDLRTSSTSVGDYFKEKLAARTLDIARSKSTTPGPSQAAELSISISTSPSIPRPTSTSAPPLARAEVAKNVSRSGDDGDTPRAGLGSRVGRIAAAETHDGGESPRIGPGAKFGSLMGSFSSLKPTENSVSDMPKNEESPFLDCSQATRVDEQTPEEEKKRRKGEVGKKEKKLKKLKETVSEVEGNGTDVESAREEKTSTSDCKKGKETPQISAERREKKKKRKDKKEKRQDCSQ